MSRTYKTRPVSVMRSRGEIPSEIAHSPECIHFHPDDARTFFDRYAYTRALDEGTANTLPCDAGTKGGRCYLTGLDEWRDKRRYTDKTWRHMRRQRLDVYCGCCTRAFRLPDSAQRKARSTLREAVKEYNAGGDCWDVDVPAIRTFVRGR